MLHMQIKFNPPRVTWLLITDCAYTKNGKAKNKNDWFDEQCEKVIEKRKEARTNFLQQITEENKTVCRQKKRQALERKMIGTEENYNRNHTRNFYKGVKNNNMGY